MTNDEELRQLIRYDKDSGKLFWEKRVGLSGHDKNFNRKYANKQAGTVKKNGYRYVKIKGKTFLAHRLAWFLNYGGWPEGFIDHINRKRDDNKLTNLREVTHSQNLRNCSKRKDNLSGTVGVHFESERSVWRASIGTGNGQKLIGRFKTKDQAVQARLKEQKLYNYHENHGRVVH